MLEQHSTAFVSVLTDVRLFCWVIFQLYQLDSLLATSQTFNILSAKLKLKFVFSSSNSTTNSKEGEHRPIRLFRDLNLSSLRQLVVDLS